MSNFLSSGLSRLRSLLMPATKLDLMNAVAIMNAQIKAFTDSVKESFATIGTSVDNLKTAVDGITSDVQSMKKKIDDLQNAPGQLGPEDQAALDSIQSDANNAAQKLQGVAQVVKALDDATAPEEVPTPPPNV